MKQSLVGNNRIPRILIAVWMIFFTLIFTVNESLSTPWLPQPQFKAGVVESPFWGPIAGARVSNSLGDTYVSTDETGHYSLVYFLPPCPGFVATYNGAMTVELYYQHFNPKRDSFQGKYYVMKTVPDVCSGLEALFQTVTMSIPTLLYQDPNITSVQSNFNFIIDIAFMSGQAIFKNEARPDILLEPQLAGIIPIKPQTTHSTSPAIPKDQVIVERGLLSGITKTDLANTDLYVFNQTDGKLITSMKLAAINVSSETETLLNYTIPVRVPPGLGEKFSTGGKTFNLSIDKVQVILINRVTGYMGSMTADVQDNRSTGGNVSITVPEITLGPPHLKITAERKTVIKEGITKGKNPDYPIGFEGSALEDDTAIVIKTEWKNADGTPLPEGLTGYGFTGRLAKVVKVEDNVYALEGAPNSLIAQFGIKPGTHMEVVKVGKEDIKRAHYYIHVSAEPTSGNPDFGSAIGAPDPRPTKCVPIRVNIYDAATKEYKDIYRPEMQFTVFDLDIKKEEEKKITDTDGFGVPANAPLIESMNMWDDFYYALFQTDIPILEMAGPSRNFSFSLGDGDSPYEVAAIYNSETHKLEVSNEALLKNLTFDDYMVLSLFQVTDKPNILWQYSGMNIELSLDTRQGKTCRIVPEENGTVKAKVTPDDRKVTWRLMTEKFIPDNEKSEIKVELVSVKDKECTIKADKNTGPGWIVLRAQDSENPDTYTEAAIMVGCQSCTQCDKPGAGLVKLSSVNVQIGMGNGPDGVPAGTFFLHAKELSKSIYTPEGLAFSSLSTGVEKLYEPGKKLRQVMAPQVLADIVTLTDTAYEIRFYEPSQAVTKTNGLYDVTGEPFVTWRISNPDVSPEIANQLKIEEIRPTGTVIHEYARDKNLNTWSLSKGNGLSVIEKRESTNTDGDRVVTETVTDASGNIASVHETTFHQFPWGEKVIQSVEDPGGLKLTTTTTYYEEPALTGSYGKEKQIESPDGSWVRYGYDAEGRLSNETRSYLDHGPQSLSSSVKATVYAYQAVDPNDEEKEEDRLSPRTVTEYTGGTITSRTYHAHLYDTDESKIEITEQCQISSSGYGAAGNLRTTSRYYPTTDSPESSSKIKSVTYPDGRISSYLYEYGVWDGTTFATGMGDHLRETVTHGTVDHPEGIPWKTTKEVSISDPTGNTLRNETRVYNGLDDGVVKWTTHQYDALGHETVTQASDGTLSDSIWGCCGMTSETDRNGSETLFTYDSLKRLQTATRKGVTPQPDILSTYTYDGEGRRLTETQTAGGLSFLSQTVYDGAGRVDTVTDASGLVTDYNYSNGGRTTTVVHPGGGTEVTERYLDGQIKSITGTAVVPRFYTYGVNPDGTAWTEVHTGTASLWEKTTTDLMGRTVKTEKPGYLGIEITVNTYNDKNQLVKTSTTGQADTLYIYDDLGNQVRTGLDVNGNGLLDLNSLDRISDSETAFVADGSDYFEETITKTYPKENDGTAVVTGRQKSRLTGLGTGGVVSETISIDISGNQTISKTHLDRNAKTITQTTDSPDASNNTTQVSVNGLLMNATSKSGYTISYGYDALGRRTAVTDPRTGTSTVHYNSKGQVDYTEDPLHNRTSFTYEESSGKKISETNPLNKTTRYAYNARGQITRTWGASAYPVQYIYNMAGQMTEMHTFRTDPGFTGDTWPEASAGAEDKTTWRYHEATGLLDEKVDDAGNRVMYTYEAGGKLKTRMWSREENGSPIITTYDYDFYTGELIAIDYSDTTPDITFTYDRLGRQKTVTDSVGTRTFAYNDADLQLHSETMTGLYSKTITRNYENTGVKGRNTGFTVGGYSVSYGYQAETGRFKSIGWNINSQTDTVTYSYKPNSDLIESLSTPSGLVTTYSYDPNRNLKTVVNNAFNTALISEYGYQYDSLGRRTSVKTIGQAFVSNSGEGFNLWGYNDKNELTTSNRYQGTDMADLSQPVTPEKRAYDYDPIGNRKTLTEGTESGTYAANNLNQYGSYTFSGQTTTLSHDEDGNLKSDGKTLYIWNAENRLIKSEPAVPVDGNQKIEYIYDFQGRRVKKSLFTRTSGSWQLEKEFFFVYDSWNLIEEITRIGGTDTSRYFAWGLDLSQSIQGAGGVGGLVAIIDGTNTYLPAYDANGNLGQLIAKTGGTIAANYQYDPFGKIIASTGTYANNNPFRFSTKYTDDDTGLVYYGYRYYFSDLGRWINRDPIGENGSINIYSICSNNTIRYFDSLGLFSYAKGKYQKPAWTPNPRTGEPTIKDYAIYRIAYLQSIAPIFISVPAYQLHNIYLLGFGDDVEIGFGEVIADERERILGRHVMIDIEDAITFADSLNEDTNIKSAAMNASLTETLKWFWALANILWSGDGKLDVNGSCMSLELQYHLWDPYDFEYQDAFAGLLTDRDYRRLHDVGLANEFLVTGKTATITINWTKGNLNFDSLINVDFQKDNLIILDNTKK